MPTSYTGVKREGVLIVRFRKPLMFLTPNSALTVAFMYLGGHDIKCFCIDIQPGDGSIHILFHFSSSHFA
jgi:hypothetical protein